MKASRGLMKPAEPDSWWPTAESGARRRWIDARSVSRWLDASSSPSRAALPIADGDFCRGASCVSLNHGWARGVGCEGVTGQSVALQSGEPFARRYCGPHHLLVAHERLTRRQGCTTVGGLAPSRLENLTHTLTFVPAGREFREWHVPDVPSRAIYIYMDPRAAIMLAEPCLAAQSLPARIHFRSPALWQTVLKLKAVLEAQSAPCSRYGTALGVLLAHELAQQEEGCSEPALGARGGLAAWQRCVVTRYIEEHLVEAIPVATLAALAKMSRYHFGRAFKVSFGTPPHRFHAQLRLERAKELLSASPLSVTEIALEVGFHETSSFSMAFRRTIGLTPSRYRRSQLAPQG